MANPIRCCNCGKKIAEHAHIVQGVVKITCKCGTVNEVKAEQNNVPYGERLQYEFKNHYVNVGLPDADGEVLITPVFPKDRIQKGDI